MRMLRVRVAIVVLTISASSVFAATTIRQGLPIAKNVEWQPFSAQVRRLIEATDYLGSPFSAADKAALQKALAGPGGDAGSEAIQRVLDNYALLGVEISSEPRLNESNNPSRLKVMAGPAQPELVEKGWRQFLVKVQNQSGARGELGAVSPNAISLFESGSANTASDKVYRKKGAPQQPNAVDLWLDIQMFNKQPLNSTLSGLNLEYRLIQLYSRDAGTHQARFGFALRQGDQDIALSNESTLAFECLPAKEVTLRVRDENGKPTTGMFVIRDKQGRVYPSQAKRLAPDFAFHPQIYRADGEKLRLPAGAYTIEYGRGPEYLIDTRSVPLSGKPQTLRFQLKRWIDPAQLGWWSGDHHIHAAGCLHYTKPSEGVHAPDMMRHCLGEDLKVGCNLTWGPCFDYQKQFFTGQDDKVSKPPYLLHYDVEVSGFGSHQSGHLCLLRLKEEIYPGGDSDKHWPKLCLNTLRWAKKQGAVVGPAHSGWGLQVKTSDLPNYIVPPFDGIGANEYIVDVTHTVPGPQGELVPAVDFLSTVDTPYVWELNMWYQTLNVGFRTRVSGETDFPCIYGERVGLGRSYVKLDGALNYDQWCEGIRQGRNYVSDGRSHLINFRVNNAVMGENGSELKLAQPGSVRVSARVASRLNEKANPELKSLPYDRKPYWDIERARIDGTREVPLEVIVNGYPVARKNMVADGKSQDVAFDVKIDRSSWVALRILPSSHTNPIFVLVNEKPIRASRRSADWCLKSVDQCWSQKQRFLSGDELEQGKKDYEHARVTYRRLLSESDVE